MSSAWKLKSALMSPRLEPAAQSVRACKSVLKKMPHCEAAYAVLKMPRALQALDSSNALTILHMLRNALDCVTGAAWREARGTL